MRTSWPKVHVYYYIPKTQKKQRCVNWFSLCVIYSKCNKLHTLADIFTNTWEIKASIQLLEPSIATPSMYIRWYLPRFPFCCLSTVCGGVKSYIKLWSKTEFVVCLCVFFVFYIYRSRRLWCWFGWLLAQTLRQDLRGRESSKRLPTIISGKSYWRNLGSHPPPIRYPPPSSAMCIVSRLTRDLCIWWRRRSEFLRTDLINWFCESNQSPSHRADIYKCSVLVELKWLP